MANKFNPLDICPFYEDPEFQEAWKDWRKVRKQFKCVMSDRAEKRHLNNLMQLSGGDVQKAIKIVDQSTDGGAKPWTKLYPLKTNPFGATVFESKNTTIPVYDMGTELVDSPVIKDPDFDEVRRRASEARNVQQ
jgi:hypothetical protein